jgi:enediyne biosynthesis protein E4
VGRMKQGIAPYYDAGEELGLSRSGWGWDSRLADFDNDGVLEAVQAMGFLKGTTNRWPEGQELAATNDQLLSDPRFWPDFRPGADFSGSDYNRCLGPSPKSGALPRPFPILSCGCS